MKKKELKSKLYPIFFNQKIIKVTMLKYNTKNNMYEMVNNIFIREKFEK